MQQIITKCERMKISHSRNIMECRSGNIGILQMIYKLITLPKDKILDSSKLKEFADDNFTFDENGRKLSK